MLFLYIIILNVGFGEALSAVCIHCNVECSFWGFLRWVLFEYIVMLKIAF